MKKIILITFLFLFYGCGYTSVYKNQGNQNFQILISDMQGDREINNLIKNQLSLYSNKSSAYKYNVSINTTYKKVIFAKNSAGVATDYQISANSVFTIYNNEKSQNVTFNEKINIKSRTDTFEQDLYEDNVKKNFASSFREKLISEILNLK